MATGGPSQKGAQPQRKEEPGSEERLPWWERPVAAFVVFAAGVLPIYLLATPERPPFISRSDYIDAQFLQVLYGVFYPALWLAAGFLLVFLLHLLRVYRYIAYGILALAVLYVLLIPGISETLTSVTSGVAFIIGLLWAASRFFPARFRRPTTYGSATWADAAHLEKAGLFGEGGLILGRYQREAAKRGKPLPTPQLLRYPGDRHLLTVAPTRAGKGVGSIIPNLLTYPGSCIVVDPKGENARLTAIRRSAMGQDVHILDPWFLLDEMKFASAFNPLDWLDAKDPNLSENALLLADSIVMRSQDEKDPFWNNEAASLLHGIFLYLATDPEEQAADKHLGRVREIISLERSDLDSMFKRMTASDNAAVRNAGSRGLSMDDKLFSNIVSTLRSHTNFLESPAIQWNVKTTARGLDFAKLKERPTTVYLVLPADRLQTFGRWLRIIIQCAITVNARNIEKKPKHPILFFLDEMPALGHLASVETAYGLMAGFGMQMWGIVQDLSQLEKIYGKGWQTFVANAGVLQYLGSRDQMTAEYFSKLCGVTTLYSLSMAIASTIGGRDTVTRTQSEAQRSLIYPDELMTLPRHRQLLLVENWNPALADKITYYNDRDFAPFARSLL